jgi:adenylate cyclase
MTQRFRLKLKKLGIIIAMWLCVGFLLTCYDFFLLKSEMITEGTIHFSFGMRLLFSMTAALFGALMGGSLLVFYINEKYRDKPYGFSIIAVLISFIVIVAVTAALLGLIEAPAKTGKPLSDPETIAAYKKFLFDPLHAKNIIAWSLVVAITQVMLQFNTKFGEGNIWKMILGKYHTPRNESRIFLCADINSSTTIAEKLGDEKYHTLLKDFFADITDPVMDNKGEIYQYVGDEVIVSWKYEEGIQQNHCINCFFDMKKEIEKNKEKYLQKYGLLPLFKAGIHTGNVVAGEIGIIKRDITFSGDVLNTVSRMQRLCRQFNVDIIVSDHLLKKLQLTGKYHSQFLGLIKLRGKEKDMELCTLLPVQN